MSGMAETLLNYVDSMMIIDKNYNIIYTNRFNPRFSKNEYVEYINKQYFEVYPELDPKQSSMVEVLNTGKVAVRLSQTFSDFIGRVFTTNNVTFPIVRFGEVVGAIELSQDITVVRDLEDGKARQHRNAAVKIPEANNETISFEDIITCNVEMIESKKRAEKLAVDERPVLIYGETGTGKELFVQAMVGKNLSRRRRYVAQNCAAIPDTLFESMLFGSVKGAFTGAENRIGLFEQADGGILFLDELNSMPLSLQAKLLRVLQDGKIRPIGSTTERTVDVKVIAAVNKNPVHLIKDSLMREDLFYRLSSSTLYLVPLRERKEDIPLYIDYFLNLYNQKYSKRITKLSSSFKKMVNEYSWPGNVRELKHIMESMVSFADGTELTINNIPVYLKEVLDTSSAGTTDMNEPNKFVIPSITLKEMLEKVERDYLINTLRNTNGNVTKAAELLGMPRQTLKFRMDKLKIKNHKQK